MTKQEFFKAINTFFEKTYLINLEKRQDRLLSFKKEFDGLEFELFKAIEEKSPIKGMKDGEWGCLRSHLTILKNAYDNKYRNILIFEDDCKIENVPLEQITTMLDYLSKNKWDMFYFGGGAKGEFVEIPNHDLAKPVLRKGGIVMTHAYSFNNSFYERAIQILEKTDKKTPIDNRLEYIHSYIRTFLANPMMIVQKADMSDIRKFYVDYINWKGIGRISGKV